MSMAREGSSHLLLHFAQEAEPRASANAAWAFQALHSGRGALGTRVAVLKYININKLWQHATTEKSSGNRKHAHIPTWQGVNLEWNMFDNCPRDSSAALWNYNQCFEQLTAATRRWRLWESQCKHVILHHSSLGGPLEITYRFKFLIDISLSASTWARQAPGLCGKESKYRSGKAACGCGKQGQLSDWVLPVLGAKVLCLRTVQEIYLRGERLWPWKVQKEHVPQSRRFQPFSSCTLCRSVSFKLMPISIGLVATWPLSSANDKEETSRPKG
jgi:hypothetical protein